MHFANRLHCCLSSTLVGVVAMGPEIEIEGPPNCGPGHSDGPLRATRSSRDHSLFDSDVPIIQDLNYNYDF